MITPEQLRGLKELYPDAAVVCYVNSTAEIKAESDICCTSANAVQVVNSLKESRVIFVPDRIWRHMLPVIPGSRSYHGMVIAMCMITSHPTK